MSNPRYTILVRETAPGKWACFCPDQIDREETDFASSLAGALFWARPLGHGVVTINRHNEMIRMLGRRVAA